MISVIEAQRMILNKQSHEKIERRPLLMSLNHVLAEDIISPLDFPRFNSSAMDGYAVIGSDLDGATCDSPISLRMIDDIWAGKSTRINFKSGECVRIMTGAAVPSCATAVVPKEDVTVTKSTITFKNPVSSLANIRRQGEEITAGTCTLKKGTPIGPDIIGILASLGLAICPVYQSPRVTVITTGTELCLPGETLEQNQIYDSNSFAITSAIQSIGINALRKLGPLPDDPEIIFSAIQHALQDSTHIILCGGVSVGEHDHNKSILADLGVKTEFWRVNQKPGKPLYFGTKNQTSIFGVPGNPASALICYYEYIQPALLASMGHVQKKLFLKEETATLNHDVSKHDDKTHFLRGYAEKIDSSLCVSVLPKQGSHMMTSFSKTNCIVKLNASDSHIQKGQSVEIHWLK